MLLSQGQAQVQWNDRLTRERDGVSWPMIQTLEAEIDEQGSVRLSNPAHFDRRRRVLVMVMPDESSSSEEEAEGWNRPYVDLPYRYLPSAS